MRKPSPSLLVALTLCLGAPTAQAQPLRWLPVLLDPSGNSDTGRILGRLSASLSAYAGVELLDGQQAASHFEEHFSVPEPVQTEEEIEAAARSVREALKEAGFGNMTAAGELATTFQSLDPIERDQVKRLRGLTRDVFDLCLMRTGAALQAGRLDRARRLISACIQEAPQLGPSPGLEKVAPEVVELYRRKRAQLLAGGAATLDLRLSDESSQDQCVAVINGRQVETLPYRADGLLPGIEHRVQVLCQRPSRVHRVRLQPGGNSLVVDFQLDTALVSQPTLGLSYERGAELRGDHARTLARFMRAQEAVLVAKTQEGLRLSRPTPGPSNPAVDVAFDASEDELRAAALQLYAPTTAKLRPPRSVKDGSDRTALLWGGAAMGAAAALSIGLSWRAYDLQMQFRSEVPSAEIYLRDYDKEGEAALLMSISGNFLLAAAMPLVLPDYEEAPWLPWALGIVGTVAGATGAALTASGERCTAVQCNPDTLDPSLGLLVMLHGAPLLAVPLTYLVRALLDDGEVQTQVAASTDRLDVRITSSF